jgi:eukaryotic-like serine/threonine-protein kinase
MSPSPKSQSEPMGGRFEVDREVGRGAVGIVYRAWDTVEQGWVALKVLGGQTLDATEKARFAREAKLLTEIADPHIVRVVAAGTFPDETPFLAMEWLEGQDLAARMRRGPVSLAEALSITRQVALGLEAAHAAGVIHRDIKPSNVFLLTEDPGPRAKIVDFGVALDQDTRLTRTGTIVGTPAYMAPEQARAEAPIDARADLYSLGATLFELVAGRPPHVGPTAVATLARLVTTRAPRLSDIVPVPQRLDDLVARTLSTDPEGRPATATELVRALTELEKAHAEGRLSVPSSRGTALSSQGTRLVTAIVAIGLREAEARTRVVEQIRALGADTAPLRRDAVVVYLGARRALGGEAARAIEIGRLLSAEQAQVGVATGRSQVDLARHGGEVVDRAAGLAYVAEAGQLLADATTTELVRGKYEFQVRAGGSSLVGTSVKRRAEGAGGAPFVGREADLGQVQSAYERCVDESAPVLVSVTGPPGIGKSRLGREALTRLSAETDLPRIVSVRCDPFGRGHALGSAADVVRGLVGVHQGARFDAARDALSGSALATDQGENARDLLARFLCDEPLPGEQDPRGARDALWLAMTDVVLRALAVSPVVVAIEDAQWADPDSVLWTDHLVARASGQRLFLLVLVRPEFWRDEGHYVGRDHVKIELRPIARRAVRSIAKAVLGERATEALLDAIAQQAGGSPLFAEELARLTALGRKADTAPTIEAAIQVSLDATDEACREALARLSIFGMSGWDRGLAALGVEDATDRLRELAGADLVVEHAESRIARSREWGFKHALVRDVVYASLPPEQRKRLHAQAAEWLAEVGDDAARIAEHFELGDRHADAAAFWERAARRALATNALADAVRMADLALAHAQGSEITFARASLLDEAFCRLDPRAADRQSAISAMRDSAHDEATRLRTAGAEARYDHARGTGFDVARRLARVQEGARRLGILDEEARATAVLATRHAFSGALTEAANEAKNLLRLADEKGVASAAVDGWQTLAIVHQTRGELVLALEARRSAARAANAASLKEREGMLHVNVGFALTTMGAKAEARTALDTGLAIAHAIGSPEALRHARMNLLGWTATFGPDPSLDGELSDARAEADAASGGGFVPTDRATLGVLYYRACELITDKARDAAERACALLEKTVLAYRSTGNHDIVPVALGMWAHAEHRRGDTARCRALAEEAQALLDAGAASLLNEAPVYLALHDACALLEHRAQAERAIAAAMDPLSRRARGVSGTPYARTFLTELRYNAAVIALARTYGSLPLEIARELDSPS